MLELLNQLDGFDDRGDVKVVMATNKIESLDPALIRPGRIDRKILFENPDREFFFFFLLVYLRYIFPLSSFPLYPSTLPPFLSYTFLCTNHLVGGTVDSIG
jgi:hypothetical protein